ncbi:hypothetical protein [Bartonella phoceensis]|uniref:hypothetical protein n=1 Tax=Bartonella phoceensis TaxID=270249 RepID=UPI001ABAF822|nr:hypothetical protein [Bartonella phoceensis]
MKFNQYQYQIRRPQMLIGQTIPSEILLSFQIYVVAYHIRVKSFLLLLPQTIAHNKKQGESSKALKERTKNQGDWI